MGILEFNPDGSLKVPESFKGKKIDLANAIVINYEKESWSDTIDCKFTITIPERIQKESIQNLKEWVDEKIKMNSLFTSIEIEELPSNKFDLLISGKGKDNRCAWCRCFRTALKTLSINEGTEFLQKNFCKFEE